MFEADIITRIVITLGVVLFSMTFHEAMHAFVAYWLGDDTAKHQGRLTLNPVKHLDPFLSIILPIGLAIVGGPIFGGAKPVPFNPERVKGGEWGAALVAISGPLTNLLIAFLSFGVWVVVGLPGGLAGQIFGAMVAVNLGFFIFNMLPIPPLDGSRVVYALAPEFVRRGMEAVERFGIVFVFLIVLVASRPLGLLVANVTQFFVELFSKIFVL